MSNRCADAVDQGGEGKYLKCLGDMPWRITILSREP